MAIRRTALALAPIVLSFGMVSHAAALEKVRLGLNWLPEAEHCGVFNAKATGPYEAACLDVPMAGGPGTNVALLVSGGELDLAMGSSFMTLNLVNQGIPGVTVAAYISRSNRKRWWHNPIRASPHWISSRANP